MKILVTGSNGQVGWELMRSLAPLGDVVGLDRAKADFDRPDEFERHVRDIRPEVIVNAAAYTAVDKAETEEAVATRVNATSVGVLARAARGQGALLVHYSTDYVFDGEKPTPYTEADRPNPVSAYGRSKLKGEREIVAQGGDHLVLRTSWVFAARGRNFVQTVLRLAREREVIEIVGDQHGAPTWARDVAEATAHVVRCAQTERRETRFASGVFHLTASGSTTWCGFAQAIVEGMAARHPSSPLKTVKVLPIPTAAYPTPARRPLNSRLDGTALRQRFGVVMPHWERSLSRCLDEIQF